MNPGSNESSRSRILDAAAQLMSRQGYTATSVAQICKHSGLPNGSLYYHFGSKASVLAAIMQRSAADIMKRIAVVDTHLTVEQYFDVGAQSILDNLAYYRIVLLLWLEDVDDPAVTSIVEEVQDAAMEVVFDFLCEVARDAGVVDPKALAMQLTQLTFAVTRGSVAAPNFTHDGFLASMRGYGALIDGLIRGAANT